MQYFWDMLKTLLNDNCGFENTSFNAVDIILGNPKFEGTFHKIFFGATKIFVDLKWKKTYLHLTDFTSCK